MIVTYDRPYKNTVREQSLPAQPVRTSVWLCGPEMLDFRIAIQKGLLHNGEHIVVERDPVIAAEIKAVIPTLSVRPRLYCGNLEDLELTWPIDFLNMDLTGSFTLSLAEWVSKLKVATDGTLCFTMLQNYTRGNQFMPFVENWFDEIGCIIDKGRSLDVIEKLLMSLLWRYDAQGEIYGPYKDNHFFMVMYKFANVRQTSATDNNPDVLSWVKSQLPSTYVDSDNPENEMYDVIIDRLREITQIKNSIKRYDSIRGLNRSITVLCNKTDNPSYTRRHVKKAITRAGLDHQLLNNQKPID